MPVLIVLFFFLSSFDNNGEVVFQSHELSQVTLTNAGIHRSIKSDDGEKIEVSGLNDTSGLLYWYRRVETPVCLTGTCKLIDIGIYWTCDGAFFGLEVYGEPLTKTDHSNFKASDYDKLIRILKDDWSMLREYELSDLTEGPEVDGVSGATREELAGEAIEQAVYSTHTMWHLIHVGEEVQLIDLTAEILGKDQVLLETLIDHPGYDPFLIELLASGRISPSAAMDQLLLDALASDDYKSRVLAFKTLKFSDVESVSFQSKMADIYMNATIPDKVKLLQLFQGVNISDQLKEELRKDLNTENQWFKEVLMRVLEF
ncbi:MAG: hypothetical protein RLQ12_24745 [Cyclobacteriaceae bacterium]